jgi:hypothetical protein
MRLTLKLSAILFCFLAISAFGQEDNGVEAGPLYSRFRLTLASGYRTEAVGPLYYTQESESQFQWALPPFYDHVRTMDVNWTEWEFLYPLVTYRDYNGEYRLSIVELLNFDGGPESTNIDSHRSTLFPIYFHQSSRDTNLNYTAVVPFYGELKNRLFHDDIKFVLFPLYSETRKKDVVTHNYLYPIFDLRHGDHLKGWQVWPAFGEEHEFPHQITNMLGDLETVGGHDDYFAVWPFYFKNHDGIGTTNPASSLTIVPFYSKSQSTVREETAYGWPLGYDIIHDSEKGYDERAFFWPLFVNAHGKKNVARAWPFYSRETNPGRKSDFYLWPVYKYNELTAGPVERERTRIVFFLYSDMRETNSDLGSMFHRVDCWPFYTWRHDAQGTERLQVMAILEPFFPNSHSMEREYSQVWSFWRWENNPKTGRCSRSLLWNLYRCDKTPGTKNCSLLFGLFQYQSGAEGRRWRLFHLTVAKQKPRAAAPHS